MGYDCRYHVGIQEQLETAGEILQLSSLGVLFPKYGKETVYHIFQMPVLRRGKAGNFGRQEGMVVAVHFAQKQIVGADFQRGTDADDIFRAQRLFTQLCGGDRLRCDAGFLGKFVLCHAQLFPAAQYSVSDLV